MMLLQAGQLGLRRLPVFQTDALPPDMVPGVTLWLDLTDTGYLYTPRNFIAPNATVHGDIVRSARAAFKEGFGISGDSADTATLPWLKSPAVNGLPAMAFAADAGGAAILRYMRTTEEPQKIGDLMTASTKVIIAAVKLNDLKPHNPAAPAEDSVVFGSGFAGLVAGSEGDSVRVSAINYAWGYFTASVLAPRSAWLVATMSHRGGQLRCRVNGGAWDSTSCGDSAFMDHLPSVMQLYSAAALSNGGELAHLITANTAMSDSQIASLEKFVADQLGITLA